MIANSKDGISLIQTHHTLVDMYTHNTVTYRNISFTVSLVSPKGDGPLPEVGAIPGQPVKETKQALYILLDTKI